MFSAGCGGRGGVRRGEVMRVVYREHRRWLLALAAIAMFALLLAEEFILGDEPLTLFGLLLESLELALLIGCAVASALLILRMQAHEEESRILLEDVRIVRAESQRWRKEVEDHLRGLGSAIQEQFETWHLSKAEQEVGLLLLKGFSHKEIARVRHTSMTTIRQQAASIYQKANLSGRAALSAFFLEDLLLPHQRPVREGGSARSDNLVSGQFSG
jgi:DNA-binding CsgD family transcriptional regulator